MQIEKGKVRAPELGQTWVNSPPLTLRGLRGRVVLVDFWDYTCINCIHTLPYLIEWHRRYADKGLTILGVHTPEFSFARTGEFVRTAIERLGIPYPVVLDNDYLIWQAFANRCWPAKYLIDKDGYLRSFHYGEGDYAATELAVQELLREANRAIEFGPRMEPLRESDRPGATCYRTTPELYLGFRRGKIGNASGYLNRDEARPGEYQLSGKLDADVFYLSGPWLAGPESVFSAGRLDHPSSILVFYSAKEVNLVLAPASGAQTITIVQDGRSLRREDAGVDVHCAESGESVVPVDAPRMYNLVANRELGQHLLQIVAAEAGIECFAFTFVTCVAGYETRPGAFAAS